MSSRITVLITDAISQLSVGTKKAAMEIHGRSIHLTLEVYKNEIKDFIIGLTALMDGKLHPLMIEPGRLSTLYQDLIKRASQAGLTPIIEDPSILFACPTSTLSSATTGDLTVIIHVPMHSGLLHLYKFISAPIKLNNQNSVTLTINSRAEYLAIDQEQTREGQYLSDQLSNAARIRE